LARNDRFIVGLDLGSSKTCALVCQPGENGKLQVAGFGVVESKGWRKSVIANLDLAVSAVKKAVETSETAAGISIASAYLGVGGTYIKGVNSRGAVGLSRTPGATRAVTHDDILKVLQAARGITLPQDYEIVYPEPQDYALDSQEGIRNPVGMSGSRLEANVHLITGSSTALRNVVTAANLAGVEVLDTVYEPLASAAACLTADERELGVALADIGGGSTDLIVYANGSVRHTASIPVGGDHFTNDIAVVLRTTISTAERAKRTWNEHSLEEMSGAVLEVPGVGERPARMVSYASLREIIQPRANELLELIRAELERSGHLEQLGAGLVLVGGGARQRDLVPLAEQMLSLPVRVGTCTGLENISDQLAGPEYAALIGLVIYGNRRRLLRDSKETGLWARLWGALRAKGGKGKSA
jgi:cell division protein FtsA